MKPIVFLGPTMSRDDAARELDAIYLPPAAQGDIYRAVRERPLAIGLVDGYFERQPAVWHKEILFALTERVHVFGAASMGALRAAELEEFGMCGVGAVFQSFRSGELEDDDEVAVAHGDASTGYRATSEAMVNIRATLDAAEKAGAVSSSVRNRVLKIAKALFYPDRSYPRILASAMEDGIATREVDAIRSFVASGKVDQKRIDASALLSSLRQCVSAGALAGPAPYTLSHTEAWAQVLDWGQTQPPLTSDGAELGADLIAAEVRLSGTAGRGVLAAGLNRAVACILAQQNGGPGRDEGARDLDLRLRRRRGSGGDRPFDQWLRDQDLTMDSYGSFLERTANFEGMRASLRHLVDRYVVDELRMADEYVRYAQRARQKDSTLKSRGLVAPTLEDAGVTEAQLIAWYFERVGTHAYTLLETVVPALGFTDAAMLVREALREFLYQRISGSS